MTKKKALFYLISFLTLFVVTAFGYLFTNQLNALQLLIDHTAVSLLVGVLCVVWALLLFIICISLLLKEEWREEAFLVFAGTDAGDELEQAAVNDSIKKTFLMNLILLVSLCILSGFTVIKLKDQPDGKNTIFTYHVMSDYKDVDEAIKLLEDLNYDNLPEKEAKLLSEAMDESINKIKSGKPHYLIPKIVFSPYGTLWFILLQFVMFRIFLFFNRRKFL